MKNLIKSVLILLLLVGSCKPDTTGQYVYQQPDLLNDGLKISGLDEMNMIAMPLEAGINEIINGKFDEVHSLLIYRDGNLVLEEYFPGHTYKWDSPNHHGEWVEWDGDMLHVIQSDTKSITSLCIGIAIDKGFIGSVNQSIFEFLPDYQHLKSTGKANITIEHLLTMTSGLDANEWKSRYSSPQNPIIALWFPPCDDPIACILEKPLVSEPGKVFSYFGGSQILLGEILRNATGLDIDQFSRTYLFEPLGVDTLDWAVRFPNGVIEAAGGLKLRPRDMLKVGITMLNEGKWEEEQIVSKNWIEKSSMAFNNNRRINVPGTDSRGVGYSYSWWTYDFYKSGKRLAGYYAGGWGGQRIMVIPELDAVIVLTGGAFTSRVKSFSLLEKYVFPAFN